MRLRGVCKLWYSVAAMLERRFLWKTKDSFDSIRREGRNAVRLFLNFRSAYHFHEEVATKDMMAHVGKYQPLKGLDIHCYPNRAELFPLLLNLAPQLPALRHLLLTWSDAGSSSVPSVLPPISKAFPYLTSLHLFASMRRMTAGALTLRCLQNLSLDIRDNKASFFEGCELPKLECLYMTGGSNAADLIALENIGHFVGNLRVLWVGQGVMMTGDVEVHLPNLERLIVHSSLELVLPTSSSHPLKYITFDSPRDKFTTRWVGNLHNINQVQYTRIHDLAGKVSSYWDHEIGILIASYTLLCGMESKSLICMVMRFLMMLQGKPLVRTPIQLISNPQRI